MEKLSSEASTYRLHHPAPHKSSVKEVYGLIRFLMDEELALRLTYMQSSHSVTKAAEGYLPCKITITKNVCLPFP